MARHSTPLTTFASHLSGAFGTDAFGRQAEGFARFFGTPRFLIGQTVLVGIWIALNAIAVNHRWDPYPFILLNLAFSLQAAYAAPLILLAQTRQADREKLLAESDAEHREALAAAAAESQTALATQTRQIHELLQLNTRLTERVEVLTREVHAKVLAG